MHPLERILRARQTERILAFDRSKLDTDVRFQTVTGTWMEVQACSLDDLGLNYWYRPGWERIAWSLIREAGVELLQLCGSQYGALPWCTACGEAVRYAPPCPHDPQGNHRPTSEPHSYPDAPRHRLPTEPNS